ncbi:hypothetical protein B4125_1166 [Bacillus paralicheniformis]|uniref:Uncharacterized protein n=1 Tax=Bacillus paralicheniformis TaxID=1648923 RepID=A0A7Z0WTH8_9BACI|nr:hypothetical protein SC10_B2orf02490 [Bacillus paralicheniformis]OLF87493.1 hypothetical protein B4121_3945 [Bacillus paralicheniformis]OLG06985.1 hypothetical protein B4125_1166 [Bacillus paralicheniformis]TWJ62087.1 hypothetical protein CHCC5022_1702 [Bacillus paralicheniformis]TWJ69532.1 hypothetical protein CHCC4186_0261 [Bacillus paralicheniformis]
MIIAISSVLPDMLAYAINALDNRITSEIDNDFHYYIDTL